VIVLERPILRSGKRQPQERLARLVSTAADVFGRDGYARAQIQEICRAAGVSVGTFYQHFENKAELLTYLVQLAADEIPELDVTSRAAFEKQIVEYVSSSRVGIWRAWREAVLSELALRPAATRLREHCDDRLARWVGEMRATRGIRAPKVDDQTTAWLIFSALRELVADHAAPPSDRAPKVAGALWRLVLDEANGT
jgi:AcrR family transcriptional regulator